MTDPEKDREAVEWARVCLARPHQAYEKELSTLLALAEEALRMREGGPKHYEVEAVVSSGEWEGRSAYRTLAEARDRAAWISVRNGGQEVRIVPLYAGEPEEVDDE